MPGKEVEVFDPELPELPTGSGSFNALNRLTGWGYDNAGNVTAAGGASIAGGAVRESLYDAENRQTQVTTSGGGTTNYFYDGQGWRVKKVACTQAQVCTTTIFVYDAAGQLAAEYGGPTPTDTGTRYLFGDHLGGLS